MHVDQRDLAAVQWQPQRALTNGAHIERHTLEGAVQNVGADRRDTVAVFCGEEILVRGVTSFAAITEHFLPRLEKLGIKLGDATILSKDWGSLISLSRQLRDYGVPVVGPGARPYRRSRLFASLAEQLCGAVMELQSDTMRQLERALFHAVQDLTGHVRLDLFSHEGRVVIIRLLRRASELVGAGGALQWLDAMSTSTGEILRDAVLVDGSQAGAFYASVQEMKADMARQGVAMASLSIEDLGLFASPTRALRLSTIHCRRKIEMSPSAQSRNDTPCRRRTRRAPDGITATCWARMTGSRAEAGACRCAQRSP